MSTLIVCDQCDRPIPEDAPSYHVWPRQVEPKPPEPLDFCCAEHLAQWAAVRCPPAPVIKHGQGHIISAGLRPDLVLDDDA
jgi:hypothetical protein